MKITIKCQVLGQIGTNLANAFPITKQPQIHVNPEINCQDINTGGIKVFHLLTKRFALHVMTFLNMQHAKCLFHSEVDANEKNYESLVQEIKSYYVLFLYLGK